MILAHLHIRDITELIIRNIQQPCQLHPIRRCLIQHHQKFGVRQHGSRRVALEQVGYILRDSRAAGPIFPHPPPEREQEVCAVTTVRSMSGGNQQKAIIARELDKNPELLVAVQPTRGLDVGAIENIHRQLVAQRDAGKAVLLVSLELDEVMNLSDRILVMYEGEIVGEFNPKTTDVQTLGLYMSGAKRGHKFEEVS